MVASGIWSGFLCVAVVRRSVEPGRRVLIEVAEGPLQVNE
jgi:hypothetical protein